MTRTRDTVAPTASCAELTTPWIDRSDLIKA